MQSARTVALSRAKAHRKPVVRKRITIRARSARKLKKKVKKAEEELAVKEEKLDALKQELLRPEYQSSYSKLTEIQGEIDALEEEIMADMENWEALSQQLEELES